MVESGVSRSKIFVTTKYMPSHTVHSSSSVLEVLRKSLKPLSKGFAEDQQPYIDVMLIHAPWGGAKGRAENWKALVAAQKEGWIKDIGVSNLCVACGPPLHFSSRSRTKCFSFSLTRTCELETGGKDLHGQDRSDFV